MRTLNELYRIVLERFPVGMHSFICNCIKYECGFTEGEIKVLLEHFTSQRPTPKLHKNFYNNFLYKPHGTVWFIIGEGGEEIRMKFIKRLVKLTSSSSS